MLELRFKMPPIERRVFINQPRHYVRAVPANHHDQLYCRQLANCAVDAALAGFTGFSSSRWLDCHVLVPSVLAAKNKKTFSLDGMIWKQVMNLPGQPPFKVWPASCTTELGTQYWGSTLQRAPTRRVQ